MTNNEAIISFVRKYFYLTDESKEKFETILNNQKHAKEFEQIASAPDKRIFFDVNINDLETLDKSWIDFKFNFRKFCDEKNITFKDYSEGKKNNVKITKIFCKWLCERTQEQFSLAKRIIKRYNGLYSDRELFNKIFIAKNNKDDYTLIDDINFNKTGQLEAYCLKISNNKRCYLRKKIKRDNYKQILESFGLEKYASDYINKNFLGLRINTKNVKICFSLNYADWLLCSTKNSWTSCLNLENSLGYWAGLAGLVGDENRIMIFFTDMKEKVFRDIHSYNMLERVWAFVLTNGREDYLFCNKLYPYKREMNNLKNYSDIFSNLKIVNSEAKFEMHSKYCIPTIFHKKDGNIFSSSIYEDSLLKKPTYNYDFMSYEYTGKETKGVHSYIKCTDKDNYGFEKTSLIRECFDEIGYRNAYYNIA